MQTVHARTRSADARRRVGESEDAERRRRLFRLETRGVLTRRFVAAVGAVLAAKAVRLERGEHGVPGVVVREKV